MTVQGRAKALYKPTDGGDIMKTAFRNAVLSCLSFLFSYPAFAQAAQPADAKIIFSNNIDTAKKLLDMAIEFFVKYSFQILGGFIVLALGWFAAKIAARFVEQFLKKHNVDLPVIKFVIELVRLCIIGLAVIIALGSFGITIAPFIAGLSVAGFSLSFALQGPLSNYAAGATLIFTKPFKVGDIIEVTGMMGEVEDMTLARTLIRTVDGTLIVIPNKHIVGEIIHNFSDFKRLDINVGVSYEQEIDKAIAVVSEIVKNDKRVSRKPVPKVGLSEFADSSKNIYARLWCKQADYYDLMFSVNRQIDKRFQESGITIPFPQRDVTIKNLKEALKK